MSLSMHKVFKDIEETYNRECQFSKVSLDAQSTIAAHSSSDKNATLNVDVNVNALHPPHQNDNSSPIAASPTKFGRGMVSNLRRIFGDSDTRIAKCGGVSNDADLAAPPNKSTGKAAAVTTQIKAGGTLYSSLPSSTPPSSSTPAVSVIKLGGGRGDGVRGPAHEVPKETPPMNLSSSNQRDEAAEKKATNDGAKIETDEIDETPPKFIVSATKSMFENIASTFGKVQFGGGATSGSGHVMAVEKDPTTTTASASQHVNSKRVTTTSTTTTAEEQPEEKSIAKTSVATPQTNSNSKLSTAPSLNLASKVSALSSSPSSSTTSSNNLTKVFVPPPSVKVSPPSYSGSAVATATKKPQIALQGPLSNSPTKIIVSSKSASPSRSPASSSDSSTPVKPHKNPPGSASNSLIFTCDPKTLNATQLQGRIVAVKPNYEAPNPANPANPTNQTPQSPIKRIESSAPPPPVMEMVEKRRAQIEPAKSNMKQPPSVSPAATRGALPAHLHQQQQQRRAINFPADQSRLVSVYLYPSEQTYLERLGVQPDHNTDCNGTSQPLTSQQILLRHLGITVPEDEEDEDEDDNDSELSDFEEKKHRSAKAASPSTIRIEFAKPGDAFFPDKFRVNKLWLADLNSFFPGISNATAQLTASSTSLTSSPTSSSSSLTSSQHPGKTRDWDDSDLFPDDEKFAPVVSSDLSPPGNPLLRRLNRISPGIAQENATNTTSTNHSNNPNHISENGGATPNPPIKISRPQYSQMINNHRSEMNADLLF